MLLMGHVCDSKLDYPFLPFSFSVLRDLDANTFVLFTYFWCSSSYIVVILLLPFKSCEYPFVLHSE